ncbi:fam-g protein [Plasmodium gallinaceum]|uniref:Fam-g protein n=1 Tax=Plasmodium gallinaceum TaxID=5849 RepID=A0A1J1GW48_PLAGA|nr:fam-g protein [Plasmodium gallinaceum]CRG96548.1 fam-g protein [Plasmodium gallinaceum]
MKTLTLYLKITIFLLLIWMYQCFYNCYSYKTLIDKNIFQIKNELKYKRILTEGDIAAKKQTNAEECPKKCPLDNEKNESLVLDLYKNPYNYWFKFKVPIFWERFKNETSQMDHKWKLKKWNVEFQIFSNTKFNDLYSIIRSDIPDKERNEKIDNFMNEFDSEFEEFLLKCKQEMGVNKTECESMKEEGKNEKKNKKSNISKFLCCRFDNH